MYRVLVPLDTDMDRATNQVAYVTSLPCASDAVAVVLAHAPTDDGSAADDRDLQAVEAVSSARERLEEADVQVETITIDDPPSEGILSRLSEGDIDEVVLGGRKRSPTEKAILGSVTQTVILNTEIPVTVTGGT